MLPLATGCMNRIAPYISYCVRPFPIIFRHIYDQWEHCFVLGQNNEQFPCETFQDLAWNQQRVCCWGGEAGWGCNTFMGDVAKLSLFCSCHPATTKGWETATAVKGKTNHTQVASEKMWVKSPAETVTKLFVWILIAVAGSSLLAEPHTLKFIEPPQKCSEKVAMLHCNSSFAPVLLCARNCHVLFWYAALHRVGKPLSSGKICSFWCHRSWKWLYKVRFLMVSWSRNWK